MYFLLLPIILEYNIYFELSYTYIVIIGKQMTAWFTFLNLKLFFICISDNYQNSIMINIATYIL